MSQQHPAPWEAGWTPPVAPPPAPPVPKPPPLPPGNPAWVKGMKSPNPLGRPKGSTPQTILIKKMMENADGILDAMIEKAVEGDSGAAALILARIVPALKAQVQPVQFEFDHTAPVSRQAEMVLAAMAEGTVSADIGRQILDAIASLSSMRATEELEARIAALEAGSHQSANSQPRGREPDALGAPAI